MTLTEYIKSLGLPIVITCDICKEDLLIEDIVISVNPKQPSNVIMHHGLCTSKDIAKYTVVIPSIEFQKLGGI